MHQFNANFTLNKYIFPSNNYINDFYFKISIFIELGAFMASAIFKTKKSLQNNPS